MSVKTFVDTNILIYAHDMDAEGKREKAGAVLRELWSERTGVLSMQVLQEFYVNVTRKMATPIPPPAARAIVNSYASWCVAPAVADIGMAFRIEEESQIGFWDALILAAASRSGAARVLSEDLDSGQSIAGVTIENPFVGIR
jgi:predicted nucleic acid-binding protein